ncbi:MAG TPA: dihydrodipicolinate synthase family protein [Chthoniobacteraceae bacterium]|nr:dihydrodipicolinate synthase family protein [Chthoniobacteraceae bacterium]
MNTTPTYRGPEKLTGLMPVLPTPLLEDESVDEAGIERLAGFLLGFPFCGIWALATAGEDENLPVETRKQVARLLVAQFGGKVPLLVKTSEPGTRETIERTREFADLGIDLAIVHPQQKGLSQDHYLRALETIADRSPLPLYLYHNGGRGAALSLSTMIRLSRHPNIAGMKAGGSNLAELQRLALFCDSDFSVFTAGAGQMLACLAMGVAGHMAAPFSGFPELAFHLYRSFRKGDWTGARRWQLRLIESMGALPDLKNREVHGEIKALLETRGIIRRHVTAPFIEASDTEIQKIREHFDTHRRSGWPAV